METRKLFYVTETSMQNPNRLFIFLKVCHRTTIREQCFDSQSCVREHVFNVQNNQKFTKIVQESMVNVDVFAYGFVVVKSNWFVF